MELKDQICTLEQAKKLKEFGVPQNGCYVYRHWRGNGKIIVSKFSEQYHDYPKHRRQVCANVLGCAFTVAELLNFLPGPYSLDKRYGQKGVALWGDPNYYQLSIDTKIEPEQVSYYYDTAAKVCAEALIDLVRFGYRIDV